MIDGMRTRIADAGTLRRLHEGAEAHARRKGTREPGAEHFLLAALDLPDGSARKAFDRIGVDASGFEAAVSRQYADALRSVGIAEPAARSRPLGAGAIATIYRAAPSGQDVVRALASDRAAHRPLLGAHVVAIVARMEHGVAARALRVLQVDAEVLATAAEDVVRESRGVRSR